MDQLLDDRVISAQVTRLFALFKPLVEALFQELAEKFKPELREIAEKTATEVASRECKTLSQKIINLEETNSALKLQIEDLTNNYRMDNLVIHGLPDSSFAESATGSVTALKTPTSTQSNRDTIKCVLNLCNDRLGLDISESSISSAYRIQRGKKDTHRPIIVRFSSQRIRNAILAERKSLRKSTSGPGTAPIFVNEHLTRSNAAIFAQTRAMQREQKIHSTWTMNGLVYIRRTDAPGEKPQKIRLQEDLAKI
jgi:hypothetical protein